MIKKSNSSSYQKRTRQNSRPVKRSAYHPLRKTALEERLEHIVLLELTADGGREYHTMTLRYLYDYVIKSITKSVKHNNRDRLRKNSDVVPAAATSTALLAVGEGQREESSIPGYLNMERRSSSISRISPQISPPSLLPTGEDQKEKEDKTPTTSHTKSSNHHHNHNHHHHHHHHDHIITYRERLGGYLHPRDMRRLVTPFSSSNEPELIVRRHVMLLNFDPLRAIVLRDRMLLLVPDGADSILIALERSIRGGIDEMEKHLFGHNNDDDYGDHDGIGVEEEILLEKGNIENVVDELAEAVDGVAQGIDELDKETFGKGHGKKKKLRFSKDGSSSSDSAKYEHNKNNNMKKSTIFEGGGGGEEGGGGEGQEIDNGTATPSSTSQENIDMDNEWDDIEGMNWIEMPFELQSVDAVLSSVVKMLTDDSSNLRFRILNVMEQLRGQDSGIVATPGDHVQERLRILKDEVKEMEARVQGFVRAMNQILDEEEDMALMNLSRIVTHPERFIQPVPQEILNEESDEPELILEAYLQQSLSEVNALELLKGQILNTEELVSLQMDTIRNRLLYLNTLISLISLCVAMGSFIGSIFGMNLVNFLEDDESAFRRVVIGTSVGMVGFLIISVSLISNTGLMPANPRKAWLARYD